MNAPTLANIRIYPIKGLDPVELNEVQVWKYSLLHDREFALVAPDGTFINGKSRFPVNLLKATYYLERQKVTLSHRNGSNEKTFVLDENNPELIQYLNDFFETEVKIIRSTRGELMDLPHSSSLTIGSTASLMKLNEAFPKLELENLRLRFRTNLEIDGVEAFWEDQLFDLPGKGVHFKIGDVEFVGIKPCERCNVPPKDPYTGETDKTFAKKLMDVRKENLPPNSKLLGHGNYFQLTSSVFLPENQEARVLRVGDPLEIIGLVELRRI